MADESHPTRALLLDAALSLAESGGLPRMSVDEVVRAAGVSKGTFYVHFTDRRAFLTALHRRFYEQLSAVVAISVHGRGPGLERLGLGTQAYLSCCLEARGVRAMLLDVRSDPAISSEIRSNVARFTTLVAEDLAEAGMQGGPAAARLYVAMVAEAALAELELARPNAEIRAALACFAAASARPS
jgi:AcrR family transcriptional regulator